jgi:hypothetical protein
LECGCRRHHYGVSIGGVVRDVIQFRCVATVSGYSRSEVPRRLLSALAPTFHCEEQESVVSRDDKGMLTQKQRDYLLLNPDKASEVKRKIEQHGELYDPETDWWPNKYPDF